MNLSALGPLLSVATSLLGGGGTGNAGNGGSPLGVAGSLVSSLLGGGAGGANGASNGASDPFSAIMALTGEADSLATSGLGSFAGGAFAGGASSGLLGSIAGFLA